MSGQAAPPFKCIVMWTPALGCMEKKMEKLFSMIIVAFVFIFIIFTKDGNETLGKYKSSVGNIGK